MKKLLSLFLSVLMIFSLFIPVFADINNAQTLNLSGGISNTFTTNGTSFLRLKERYASLMDKMEPIISNMHFSSDDWEKASKAILDNLVKNFDDALSCDALSDTSPVAAQPYMLTRSAAPTEASAAVKTAAANLPDISNNVKSMSFGGFTNIIQKYFIVNADEIDAKSQSIVDSAEFKYTVMKDGKSTVYIFVNVEENTQLLNMNLLRATVKKLYEKQNMEYDSKADVLMSYQHIAGELAMHALMYAVSYEFIRFFNKTDGIMYEYWQKARQACLNIDEARLPSQFFEILGTYIMGVVAVNVYSIFSRFA